MQLDRGLIGKVELKSAAWVCHPNPPPPLLIRYDGREGAGGWQWRAGARARLEAGAVAAGSASPRRPRQRWHSRQREDQQLW